MIGDIIAPMFGNISNYIGYIGLPVPVWQFVVACFVFLSFVGERREMLRQSNGEGVQTAALAGDEFATVAAVLHPPRRLLTPDVGCRRDGGDECRDVFVWLAVQLAYGEGV